MTIIHHFHFRTKQILRIINENPKLSAPFVILYFIFIFIELPFPQVLPFIASFMTICFYIRRNDVVFLKKIFHHRWRIITVIESSFVYYFMIFSNIHYNLDEKTLLFYIPVLVILFIPIKKRSGVGMKFQFIPTILFEWKCFFRKNYFFILPGMIIIALSGYHQSTLIFIGIFLLDIISNIFENNENKEMFENYFSQISLKNKIKYNIIFFNLLLLPTNIVFIIFNINAIEYLIVYNIFMNLYFSLVITRKYKVYTHKKQKQELDFMLQIQYFFSSIMIIPAILTIIANIRDSKKTVYDYVKNPQS